MSSNTKESLTTCLVQYINFQRSRDLQLISSNIYDKFDQNIQSSKLEYMLEKFNFFLKRKAFDKLGICISKNKDNQQKRSKSCNLLYRDEAYQMNNILDLKKNLNITNSITMKSLNYSMTQKSKKQRDFIERQREVFLFT